jgi:hypothetical protein
MDVGCMSRLEGKAGILMDLFLAVILSPKNEESVEFYSEVDSSVVQLDFLRMTKKYKEMLWVCTEFWW